MHTSGFSQHSRSHRHRGGTWRAGLLVALVSAVLLPITAHVQTSDEPVDGDDPTYVTTTTTPDRSLDVSAFSPECIRDAPYVSYTIVPVGFVPVDEHATLVIKDRNGTVIETREVSNFSGSFLYPGASVDAAGNATDWPGWKQAENGNWIPDVSDAGLREGLIIDVTVNPTATTTVSYPPATSACNGPEARALDVTAFAPVCISDAPFISYDIKTVGFTSTGPATLTFYDVNGTFVEQQVVNSLSGRVVYPGASVDAGGTATDWPGWKQADDGSWIPDTSDAILREGLTIEVEVNPTATVAVAYPPATAACNGPGDPACVPGEDNDGDTGSGSCTPCTPGQDNDSDPADDCTPCSPGQDNDSDPANDCAPCTPGQNNDSDPANGCTPCTPGQNNDSDPADDCTLPKTGGGAGPLLSIGGAALLAGLVFLAASRRRNKPAPA